MAQAPRISVLMSVYNCESTVGAALSSLRAQTYPDWELVICDDASTDRTLNAVKEFRADNPGISVKILENAENMKLAFSLNRCIQHASGSLLARMDGDDLSEPTRFEKQVAFLDEHPEVDLVGTSMRRFREDGLGDLVKPASATPNKYTLAASSRSPFCHATIMARREVFEIVGNYTVAWRTQRGQDRDLWFKFFQADLVGRNMPDALYLVREDPQAVRRRNWRARLGPFLTSIIGIWRLRLPPMAYARALSNMLKIFVPYFIFDIHRNLSRRRG